MNYNDFHIKNKKLKVEYHEVGSGFLFEDRIRTFFVWGSGSGSTQPESEYLVQSMKRARCPNFSTNGTALISSLWRKQSAHYTSKSLREVKYSILKKKQFSTKAKNACGYIFEMPYYLCTLRYVYKAFRQVTILSIIQGGLINRCASSFFLL